MIVSLASPVVRVDVVQRVIKDIFEAALVPTNLIREIVWGVTNESRPERPYGFFDWISGPAQLDALGYERQTVLTESDYWIDIPASPVAGHRYSYRLNGQPHTYLIQAGDTSDQIRDLFIDSINNDLEPATASIVSATRLLVQATTTAGIYQSEAALPLVASVATPSTQQPAIRHHQRQAGTVALTIYTEDPEISKGAQLVASKAMVIPCLNLTIDTLSYYGINILAASEPVSDTAISFGGAKYEGIATIDYEISMPSNFMEPIETIESVLGSLTADNRTVPITIP